MEYTQTLHGTAIYAYIGVVSEVNVGKYAIHGVYGIYAAPGQPLELSVQVQALHRVTL